MLSTMLFVLLQAATVQPSPEAKPSPAATCTVQMDIKDFPGTPEQVQKLCGGPNSNMKKVLVSGDREAVRYEITYDREASDFRITGHPDLLRSMELALTVRGIFKSVYPTEHFFFGYRDVDGSPVCGYAFSGDSDIPDGGEGCVVREQKQPPQIPHQHKKPQDGTTTTS